MTQARSLLLCSLLIAAGVDASAQITVPALDLTAARRLATIAAAEARTRQAGGAIAVVDAGGHLLLLERLDGTFPAAAAVSVEKARTAAIFRVPTRVFEEAIRNGRHALLGVGVMTPLQGGVPLMVNGQVAGAIGISGAHSAQEDDEIAQAAVTAFARPVEMSAAARPVTWFTDAEVAAAFAKGAPLVETATYKIHASRRAEAGQAEVHARDTDVIHVLEGGATLVTGGTVVEPRQVGPDEVRGGRIEGGTTRALSKGEVVVVPAGVPHWFSKVQAPFLYYVVKVVAADAGSTH